jgi:putative Mg2+ transporter-C (MgtC) family protein
MNFGDDITSTGVKLLLALLCGGFIGLEREINRKPAGLRTHALICMGSTLFMITSRHISGGAPYTDPARLVAQVVAGIGFIGAGVILQSRGSVTGLTTAATIFVVTAVGISIGEGMFAVAILSASLIIFVLVVMRKVETIVLLRRRLFHYSFRTRDPSSSLSALLQLLDQEGVRLEGYSLHDSAEGVPVVKFSVISSIPQNAMLTQQLSKFGVDVTTETGELLG